MDVFRGFVRIEGLRALASLRFWWLLGALGFRFERGLRSAGMHAMKSFGHRNFQLQVYWATPNAITLIMGPPKRSLILGNPRTCFHEVHATNICVGFR